MSLLKYLYPLSIALLVLAFVVFGIAALPAPQAPDIPPELQSIQETPTEEQQELLAEQGQQQQAFQEQISVYNQVVSFLIIGTAVVLLAGSILRLSSFPIIGEGVTLGAVFTLLYGLYYAYSVAAGVVTFLTVTVGLALLLTLFYWKFAYFKVASGWNPAHVRLPNPKQAESGPLGFAGREE